MRRLALAALLCACSSARYGVILRHGTVYDGTGAAPIIADVALSGDRVAAVGDLSAARADVDIDATGMAVAPGFINMLSHSEETLLVDGAGEGAIRQGVTLEVFGEFSMGPLDERMAREAKEQQSNLRYDITWRTLGEYLAVLEKHGIAPNVATLVGAGTVRERVIGRDNRAATATELDEMRRLVAQAMDEGALGLTTALIYPPDTYSTTAELIALAREAAAHGGIFTAHIRNEGNHIDRAVDELITIAREANLPVEMYHFKLAGRRNWGKLDAVVAQIEAARAAGLHVTADMYTYPAGATGLDAAMPAWVQEGGYDAWAQRLRDPALRARVAAEMRDAGASWDNLYALAGPEGVRFVGFKNPALRKYLGKSVAEVAAERHTTPEDVAMDLVVEDGTRVEAIYFLMSEENIRREIALPWMSFGCDAGAMSPRPPFTDNATHPRAYGNFARLLGKYVREDHVISLQAAIARLTSLPATNLGLVDRGVLRPGAFADVVVFDPARIADRATFEQPHQVSVGVHHVFVNGVAVLRAAELTRATPGGSSVAAADPHQVATPVHVADLRDPDRMAETITLDDQEPVVPVDDLAVIQDAVAVADLVPRRQRRRIGALPVDLVDLRALRGAVFGVPFQDIEIVILGDHLAWDAIP
jgi:N-acyl-D-amino-acid deacylase